MPEYNFKYIEGRIREDRIQEALDALREVVAKEGLNGIDNVLSLDDMNRLLGALAVLERML